MSERPQRSRLLRGLPSEITLVVVAADIELAVAHTDHIQVVGTGIADHLPDSFPWKPDILARRAGTMIVVVAGRMADSIGRAAGAVAGSCFPSPMSASLLSQ